MTTRQAQHVQALITLIESTDFSTIADRDFRKLETRVDGWLTRLNAAWSNPGSQTEADRLKSQLVAAWNKAN